MDKNQEQKQQQQKPKDEFAEMLQGFNENPLNLTNQEKDKDEEDDPEVAAKIKQQYQKIFKGGFSDFGESSEEPSMEGLGNALGNLLKGFSEQFGGEGGQGEQFSKKFVNMFQNLDQNNMEEAASNLLNEFMDKSLLLEPLQETKINYQQYFKKQEGKIPQPDLKRYKSQYEIVLQILQILQANPENKSQMISLFQKMQEYGNPPEGIAPATGFM